MTALASPVTDPLDIERDAPIPTWFHVGGRAERLVRPASVDRLRRALEIDPGLLVLGDGANLLVDDDGVPNLVVALTSPEFRSATIDDATGLVHAPAGVDLRRLITDTVRRGLAGLEVLAGIPATIGGAVVMNAGGAFGQIADVVERVHALDRRGRSLDLDRSQIAFSYRHSGLNDLVITAADLRLRPVAPGDRGALRERLVEISDYKKRSQPLAAHSAGCAFRNPTLARDLRLPTGEEFAAGARVSAGLLLDRAGCKGMVEGSARVSDVHANFVTARKDGLARDVIALIDRAAARVLDRFGVRLEREVVIWSRHRP
ncbi:MAG: UDP-N-acetylmuramate dehydrogenase [Phycisphaerae bacterium]|nr:UDP-N-acetylmuramate dehydrogenase [Phycisphaerae bacterium]